MKMGGEHGRTKEDLIRKSEWVTLEKIQVSWKQDLNFF
jgi:hypothetical protein